MSDEMWSMQWKTTKKEAWWPKCAAPRLVYDSALFETFMHVYVVRTIRTTKLVSERKYIPPPEVGSREGHVQRVCTKFRDVSLRNGVDIIH